MKKIKGRAWKYGDNLDTDEICPASILLSTSDPDELARHAMEGITPGFSKMIKPGDILVAGRNTGCGSSREQAPLALKQAGISAVVADSFARIFFRNCVTIGLPVLEGKGISQSVNDGDMLEVDVETGRIENHSSGKVIEAAPLQDFALQIIEDGGLISHFQRQAGKS